MDSGSGCPSRGHSHPNLIEKTRLGNQNYQRVCIRLAVSPDPNKIFRTSQTEFALHPVLEVEFLLVGQSSASLPTNALDVFVGSGSQLITAFQAATFEHRTPIG